MCSFLLVGLLCLAAVSVDLKEIKGTPRIVVKIENNAGLELMLPAIYESINYAYDIGSGADGRMSILETKLRGSDKTKEYFWVAVEDGNGVSHTSHIYGYFKITQGLFTHSMKLVAVTPKSNIP